MSTLSASTLRSLVDLDHESISISRQCELLGLSRSAFYYRPVGVSDEDLERMSILDKVYTQHPYYGSRRLRDELQAQGEVVCRDHVRRLMRLMGIEAIYPKPRLSLNNKAHKVYPYLLRGLCIDHPDHVWCCDITYIQMEKCFAYLVAIMDWYSRYVLSWELSMSLEVDFCVSALDSALSVSRPEIFNSDQGSQFTSEDFTSSLQSHDIRISMDGRGRAFDNIMIERLWRTVKYEDVYLKEYPHFFSASESLGRYFRFYNEERRHSSLGNKTPSEVYWEGCERLEQAG